ncbi:endonuclease/exonuclease/phosphatase family protein [Psychroserpens mesophilus]|uniref:endonuclease/exonuclease/phosphatase family protein n=1 Tax=Psychroserpens mesophilus TaxID=325473 RepID=UPI003D65B8FA
MILKQNYKAYLLIGYAFLLIIHFILKDRIFPLSIFFYGFPLIIIIGITVFLIILFYKRQWYRYSLIAIFTVLTIIWYDNYYFQTNTNYEGNTTKILYWNLAKRNQLPVDIISEKVNNYQPEILAFVEAPEKTLKNLNALKSALPNYNFTILKGAMLVAAKGNIVFLNFEYQEDSYKANLLEVTTTSEKIKFIVTDLTSNLLVNKKRPMTFVSDFAKRETVDFITGDFNSVYESIYFNELKNNFTSFHKYNNGFTATWPLGIPLLEIDHFWLSHKHQPIQLIKFQNNASDHAMLISEFKFNRN